MIVALAATPSTLNKERRVYLKEVPVKKMLAVISALLLLLVFAPLVLARDNTPAREYRTVASCRNNDLRLESQGRYFNYVTRIWGSWRILDTKHVKDGCAPKLMAPVANSYGARLNFVWAEDSQGTKLSGRLEAIGIGKGYSTCLLSVGDQGCLAFAATDVFKPDGSWFEIFLIPTGSYDPIQLLVANDTPCPWRPAHTCFALGQNQELTAVVALPNENHLIP